MPSKRISGLLLAIILLCVVPVTCLAAELQTVELNLDYSELQHGNVSASVSVDSAEYLLSILAANGEAQRITGGTLSIINGTLMIGIASLEGKNPYEFGVPYTLLGIISLTTPTLSESYYLEMITISDPVERETAAANYLSTLASQSKSIRLTESICNACLAVYFFTNPSFNPSNNFNQPLTITLAVDAIYNVLVKRSWEGLIIGILDAYLAKYYYSNPSLGSFNNYNQYLAITSSVSAISGLLGKSPEEQVWESYQKNQGSSTLLTSIQLGVNPSNGALCLEFKLKL